MQIHKIETIIKLESSRILLIFFVDFAPGNPSRVDANGESYAERQTAVDE